MAAIDVSAHLPCRRPSLAAPPELPRLIQWQWTMMITLNHLAMALP